MPTCLWLISVSQRRGPSLGPHVFSSCSSSVMRRSRGECKMQNAELTESQFCILHCEFCIPLHLRFSKYANKSCISSPLISFGGIIVPGLIAPAFAIQPARFPFVLRSCPAASVGRDARCVRSG